MSVPYNFSIKGLIAALSAVALGVLSMVTGLSIFACAPTFSYAADISRIYIDWLLGPASMRALDGLLSVVLFRSRSPPWHQHIAMIPGLGLQL